MLYSDVEFDISLFHSTFEIIMSQSSVQIIPLNFILLLSFNFVLQMFRSISIGGGGGDIL